MANLITYMPAADEFGYTFGGRTSVTHLCPGDVLRTFTEDCFGGAVHGVDDLPSRVCAMPYLNPVTGPFHVEGAEPGDTLAIHLIDIVPARAWGISATFPHFGALTSTDHTATLQPPLPERVWWYPIDNDSQTVRYQAGDGWVVDLPLEPMLGTIGVAPAGGQATSSITGDSHGGNLDTPQIRAGVTVYLGVNAPGGMLSIGDGHARQGQGELCGVAVETAMHVTLVVDVIKNVATPWPRLKTDTAIMSIGCARPLEDAFRISQRDLVDWVAELTGLDQLDAYQLVAQAGTASAGNVCDPNYTMLAGLEMAYLPGARPYGGVHQRLRQTPVPADVRAGQP